MTDEFKHAVNNLTGMIFFAGIKIGFASFSLIIMEAILYWFMVPLLFKIGKKVVRKEDRVRINPSKIAIRSIVETDSGRFKFLNDRECIFHAKQAAWFAVGVRTPFPLRGPIAWKDAAVSMSGRVPLGATIFFVVWLIVWIAGSIGYGVQEGASSNRCSGC